MQRLLLLSLIACLFACQKQDQKAKPNEEIIEKKIQAPFSLEKINRGLAIFDSAYHSEYGDTLDVMPLYDSAAKILLPYSSFYPKQEDTLSWTIRVAKLGYALMRMSKVIAGEKYIEMALQASPSSNKCLLRFWLGNCKYAKLDFYAAKDLHISCLECMTWEKSPEEMVLLHQSIANTYWDIGVMDSARNYAEIALAKTDKPIMQIKLNMLLGLVAQNEENYNQAIHYFETAEKLIQSIHKATFFFYFNYGKLCKDIANTQKDSDSLKAKSYFQLARYYYSKEEHTQSYIKDTLQMGIVSNNIGFSYKDEGKLDSAILAFQTSFSYLVPNYTASSPYQIPEIKETRSLEDIIRACSGMGKTLKKQYDTKGNIQDLDAAVNYFALIPSLMLEMRKTLGGEESKSLLTSLLYNVYEPALGAAFLLNEKQPSPEHLQAAYNFIQAGKSLSLLEDIQDKSALQKGGIPLDLLKKDSTLQAEILAVQQQIDKRARADLYAQKNAYLEEQRKLHATFEEQYPQYHALKYPSNSISIFEIQQKCKQDKTQLIDYFQGKNAIYAVYIAPDKQGIIQSQIQEDSLKYDIDSLFFMGMKKEETQRYAKAAHSLYRTLMAQIDSLTPPKSDISKLFIPDGYLHKIPFEALLYKPIKGATFGGANFLIQQYPISYIHSAFLWLHPITGSAVAETEKEKILGLAPGFSSDFYKKVNVDSAKKFAGLPRTLKSLKSLSAAYPMDLYAEQAAKKSAFFSQAPKYPVLHFGTHAVANDASPSLSYLVLAPEKQGDSLTKGYLFTNDIYATHLNARLAILTACQTGKGQIKKGEGVMSLARAFRYAGCHSILMTLWQVNESPTAKITEYFYENIHKDKPLNVALHEAKIRYLTDAKPYEANPYNWSALILIGETEPCFGGEDAKGWKYFVVIGFGLLMALSLGYWFLRRRRR